MRARVALTVSHALALHEVCLHDEIALCASTARDGVRGTSGSAMLSKIRTFALWPQQIARRTAKAGTASPYALRSGAD